MEKLKSRKLWVAIITAVLVALNDQLQLGFTQDSLISFVTIAVGYILGQSHVDAKKEQSKLPGTDTFIQGR